MNGYAYCVMQCNIFFGSCRSILCLAHFFCALAARRCPSKYSIEKNAEQHRMVPMSSGRNHETNLD